MRILPTPQAAEYVGCIAPDGQPNTRKFLWEWRAGKWPDPAVSDSRPMRWDKLTLDAWMDKSQDSHDPAREQLRQWRQSA